MADKFILRDLELRILLLPPISRGAHLAGPLLHARRLIDLWRVEPDGDVPLAQTFRLLDEAMVAGVILRRLATEDYSGDPRHWAFPPIDNLLPELREASWQALLAGTLLAEGIKGAQGKQYHSVLLTELPRLTPDWELSRLTRGADDVFVDVRVRHAPAEPVKKTWREKSPKTVIKAATLEIDKRLPPGILSRDALQNLLVKDGVKVSRADAQKALDLIPHRKGRRGYSKGKSPK